MQEDWLKNKVGSRLQAAGVNFSALAKWQGISPATLAGRLENPGRIKVEYLDKLAADLRVKMPWLMDGDVGNALDDLDSFMEAVARWDYPQPETEEEDADGQDH